MILKYGKQLEFEDLCKTVFDLSILAYNHEKRYDYLINKLSKHNALGRILIFTYPNLENQLPEDLFEKVHVIRSVQALMTLINEEISNLEVSEPNILVDYSCMTKSWYYSILLYLKNLQPLAKTISINAYFSYTPSKWSEPQLPKPNKNIGPLPGKYRLAVDKPKALIVGLGYEHKKAAGLIDYLDPKECYLFLTDPCLDVRFENSLKENNKGLLDKYTTNTVKYPFDNLYKLERELMSLYYLLKDNFNIIIAPLGPKPFALSSMVLSSLYDEIDIWRVGSGSDINEYDRQPLEGINFIITYLNFSS